MSHRGGFASNAGEGAKVDNRSKKKCMTRNDAPIDTKRCILLTNEERPTAFKFQKRKNGKQITPHLDPVVFSFLIAADRGRSRTDAVE